MKCYITTGLRLHIAYKINTIYSTTYNMLDIAKVEVALSGIAVVFTDSKEFILSYKDLSL